MLTIPLLSRTGVLHLQPTLSAETFGLDRVSGEVPFRVDMWGSNPGDMCTSNQASN